MTFCATDVQSLCNCFSESATSSVGQTTTSSVCEELMTQDTPAIIESSSGNLPDGQKVPTPENPWVSDVTDSKPTVKITVSNVDDVTMTSVSLPKTDNVDNIIVSVYKKDTETVSH